MPVPTADHITTVRREGRDDLATVVGGLTEGIDGSAVVIESDGVTLEDLRQVSLGF